MHAETFGFQALRELPDPPKEKVSRHTVRPGTLGLTLVLIVLIVRGMRHHNSYSRLLIFARTIQERKEECCYEHCYLLYLAMQTRVCDRHYRQTKSDTDNNDDNDFQYLSSGTRNHDSFSNADFLTKDHHKTEGIGDALNSELVDQPEYQDSGLRRRELCSAPSTPSNRS
jgi:hypothetical protein